MVGFRRLWRILKHTGTAVMLVNFLWIFFVAAIALWFIEPGIPTVGDSLWYLFVASTTIGFGDFAATTLVGRIITVFISLLAIILTAMITGVVVNYYSEYLKVRQSETISMFLEKLEDLPELSHEELVALSNRVRRFNDERPVEHP